MYLIIFLSSYNYDTQLWHQKQSCRKIQLNCIGRQSSWGEWAALLLYVYTPVLLPFVLEHVDVCWACCAHKHHTREKGHWAKSSHALRSPSAPHTTRPVICSHILKKNPGLRYRIIRVPTLNFVDWTIWHSLAEYILLSPVKL